MMIWKLLFLLTFSSFSSANVDNPWRLPQEAKPINYKVIFKPDYSKGGFKNIGNVTIDFLWLANSSSDRITLNLNCSWIHKNTTSLKKKSSMEKLSISNISYSVDLGRLYIYIENPLEKGEEYILFMDFYPSTLKCEEEAVTVETHFDTTTQSNLIAYYTQSKPTYARKLFPCFDEPEYKATFDLTIGRPKNLTCLSNTPLLNSSEIDGLVYDTFQTTPNMSTYLVAFVISNYSSVGTHKTSSVNFTMWGTSQDLHEFSLITELVGKIYQWYDKYFNVTSPINKTDIVLLDNMRRDGYENWGLITLNKERIHKFYGQYLSRDIEIENLALLSALLAHNWFGNLVTPKWWSDVWLSEGLSNLMAIMSLVEEEPDIWSLYMLFLYQRMLSDDSDGQLLPLQHEVEVESEIEGILNNVTTIKGSIIGKMLLTFFGNDVFQNTTNKFIFEYTESVVTQDDFWNVFPNKTNQTDFHTKNIMDVWTKQSGYPLITVTIDYENQAFNVSQKPINQSEKLSTWNIPIQYQMLDPNTNKSTYNFVVLNESMQTFQDKDIQNYTVFIANLNAGGYYRVNYDNATWDKIIYQLLKNHLLIHVFNRAQLIDDTYSLAEMWIVEYKLPYKIVSYLYKEEDPLPWLTFFKHLNKIVKGYCRNVQFLGVQTWIDGLTKETFELMKEFHEKSNMIMKELFKSGIWEWSCSSQNKNCTNQALSAFEEWMNETTLSKNITINLNLLPTIICVVFASENYNGSSFIFDQFNKNNSDLRDSYSSFACLENFTLIRMALDNITNGETYSIVANLAKNLNGRDSVFSRLKNKDDKIFKLLVQERLLFDSLVQLLLYAGTSEYDVYKILMDEYIKDGTITFDEMKKSPFLYTYMNIDSIRQYNDQQCLKFTMGLLNNS